MPITQDRFIDALEGADALTKLVFGISRLCKTEPRLMSDANSVLEHSDDVIACDVIRDLLAKLEAILVLITDNNEVTNEMAAKIQGELRYFARVHKTNARAAYYQRKRRGTLELPAAPVERTSTNADGADWQPDLDKARRELEAEGKLQEKPTYVPRKEREAQVASGETNALTMRSHSYDPSVLRTSVPPLAQLNAQGTASADEDVL